MNILAIDTSTKLLCVGAINNTGKIVEYNIDTSRQHMEMLLPVIKKTLRRLKVALNELDYFAVGLGPGSFTGLRIGLATIKALSLSLNKPIIGISSLDIIAANAAEANTDIVCPLVDAKRHLVFTTIYNRGTNSRLKRKGGYSLISIEELLLKLDSSKRVSFLGDGLMLYKQTLKHSTKRSAFLPEEAWYPKAGNLIRLSLDLINRGKLSSPDKIKPIYLYPKECQIRK